MEYADTPTDAQIKYACAIAKKLDLEIDDVPFTKKDYSDFISEWEDEYNFFKGIRE